MAFGKCFGHQQRRRCATGGRTGHQAREHTGPEHGGVHHVVHRQLLAQQGQRVARRVAAGLGAHLGERLQRRAVLLHVAQARAAKVAQGEWQLGHPYQRGRFAVEVLERAGPVVEHGANRTRVHLLEAQRQHTVHRTTLDRLPRQKECGGAGGAVVVDVDDGDTRHAHAVQRLLPGGRVAINIAHIGLLYQVIGDARISQRQACSLGRHARVGRIGAGFSERDHAHACDKCLVCPVRHVCLLEWQHFRTTMLRVLVAPFLSETGRWHRWVERK